MVERNLKQKLGSFIIDHLGLGMFRYDAEQKCFDYVNGAFSDLLGYECKNEMLSLCITDLFKNRSYAEKLLKNLKNHKTVKNFEAVLNTVDGKTLCPICQTGKSDTLHGCAFS